MEKGNCEFTGRGGQYFPTVFIHLMILGTFTLGIYIPWALCRLWRLKASHTKIRGKDVSFTGRGGDLFILTLIQGLLTLVTIGIYAPWAVSKILKWKMDNTLVSGKPSVFNGTGGSLFFLYLIHLVILPMLTLGIYYLWGLYRFYAWKEEKSLYGGEKTSFGAGLGGFVKISVLSWILNALTLQLFTPWSICWLYRWQIEGLRVGPEPEIEHYPPVKTNVVAVALLVIVGLGAMYGVFSVVKNQAMMAFMMMNQLTQIGKMRTLQPERVRLVPLPNPKPTLKKRRRSQSQQIDARRAPRKMPRTTLTNSYTTKEIRSLMEFGTKHYGSPEAYYNRGLAFYLMGKFDQAIREYTRAIGRNRKDVDSYYNRALAYLRKREYNKAIRDLAVAIKYNPKAADAYCNRAGANFQLGKLDRALADYSAAIKLSPNDPDLYKNRALVYKALGQMDKAAADLEKAKALTQKDTPKPGLAPVRTPSATWRDNLEGVNIPTGPAVGMIHGEPFHVQDAMLENGILTLREGQNFFADREIKIFTFKSIKKGLYGTVFRASTKQKYGVPHVHLSWMEKGKNLPKIKIYSGGYSMVLRIGQREGDFVPGAIYVCLPDGQHSFVAGSFRAKIGRTSKKY